MAIAKKKVMQFSFYFSSGPHFWGISVHFVSKRHFVFAFWWDGGETAAC